MARSMMNSQGWNGLIGKDAGIGDDPVAEELDVEYESEGEDENASEANSFLEELESDLMSHVADYQFPGPELDWIEKHYGHSGNFSLSYGLKPFDDGDCKEGRALVKQMMRR